MNYELSGDKKLAAFERWRSLASGNMKEPLLRAAKVLTSYPLEHGFQLEKRAFDSSDPPAYALNLEQSLTLGETSFIYIGFDKYYRARFQIIFGTKKTSPSHHWIRSGALVWKNGSECQKYKWWGVRWWSINKIKEFNTRVDKAAEVMPQVLEYLSNGVIGSHVLAEPDGAEYSEKKGV